MPMFNFKPIELKDPLKCVGCRHFDIELGDYHLCRAMPKTQNYIHRPILDPATMTMSYEGVKYIRPDWCPLEEVK